MVISQFDIKTGLAITVGTSYDVDVSNTQKFNKIVILHTTGSISGGSTGSYVANCIFEYIKLNVNGVDIVSLVGDQDAGICPWAVTLNRTKNLMKNMVADTAEYFVLDLPFTVGMLHNARLTFKVSSITNLQTAGGDRTTYASATVDVFGVYDPTKPDSHNSIFNVGKISTNTLTGNLTNFVNPTQAGYQCSNLIGIVEDNGTASDTAIAKITVKIGSLVIAEGTVAKFRQQMQEKYGVATPTGVFIVPINRPVRPNEVELILNKTAAGTAVDLHWYMIQVR